MKIENQAQCAEYAAKFGIPYDAAVGVFILIGAAGIKKILER